MSRNERITSQDNIFFFQTHPSLRFASFFKLSRLLIPCASLSVKSLDIFPFGSPEKLIKLTIRALREFLRIFFHFFFLALVSLSWKQGFYTYISTFTRSSPTRIFLSLEKEKKFCVFLFDTPFDIVACHTQWMIDGTTIRIVVFMLSIRFHGASS